MSTLQSEQSEQRGGLASALAAARLAAPWWVAKGGYNAHNKYPFVGHPDVMAHSGRTVLAENGLALVQTCVEYVNELPGSKHTVLLWRGEYQLLHESGEAITIKLQATTQAGDKAAFVASTALDRTAWLRVLALAGSDDEDPDYTGQNHNTGDPRQAQAQRVAEQRDEPPQLSEGVIAMLASLDNAQTREDAEKVLGQARALRAQVTPYEKSAIDHHAGGCMQRHGIEPRQKGEARS